METFKAWRSGQNVSARRVEYARSSSSKSVKKRIAPATVNRELALLKILFNFYMRSEVIDRNPVTRVKLLKEPRTHLRVISREEERLYLMAASPLLKEFATVMLDTGMRNDEVARLQHRDVNIQSAYLIVGNGKTQAAKRKIPLTSRVLKILENRMAKSQVLLFSSSEQGGQIKTLKTSHAGALRRSGVAPFRLYDLRHTFAKRFLEARSDLITLQAILGHSSIHMVTRYAHPTDGHKVDAIRRMEEQFQTGGAGASKAASA